MALWSKSLPASFCLSRYAPPLLSCETGWKWHRNFISSGFYTLGDVRAATSVELRVSKCATKMDGPNTKNPAVGSDSEQHVSDGWSCDQLTCVYATVLSQVGGDGEGLPTLLADVGPLPSVGPHVFLQVASG
ncbi:hypothetical protein GOODEAATRI_034590 [Goodea atripinnis]|uniref:Uncharacterized protein n=1 Tax=Goodea atripinnis TaxID=208336 RepID=A0ABV0NQI5_9TELE